MAQTKPAVLHLTLALLLVLASALMVARVQPVLAGGTPASGTVTDQLLTQQGSGVLTQYGDYVGSSGGLNTYYSYFIEVPSGLSQLVVDIFDADVGSNGFNNDQANERDRAIGAYNTCARYTLYRPNGTPVSDVAVGPSSGCFLSRPYGNCPACDNTWQTLYTVTDPPPPNGHWELRVDMSSSVTSGDDVNAFGIRAHDGAPGSGGTELNVYAASFHIVGINDNGRSRSYTAHPYVTSGCSGDVNDFDWDASGGNPYGSLTLTSPGTAFSHSNPTMSANDSWQNTSFTDWTSDSSAHDYGIWTGSINIEDYGSGNYGVVYVGNFAASAPPPTSQPQANTFRVYFPTDAGGAPIKPYVRQYLTRISGPNPPQVSQTTRFSVLVEVLNPSGSLGAISFSSPSNLVTANVPGDQVVYADNASATGTIVGQPVVGGSGNITWDPGTVAAGATATLSYEVDVTPALPGARVPVTGTPLSNGTIAQYLDETGNASQARATYTFGPLCELAITEGVATAITLTAFSARSAPLVATLPASSSRLTTVMLVALVGALTGALLVWRCAQNGEDSTVRT